MEQLRQLYRRWSGSLPHTTEPLAGAGSNRKYYRMAAADGTAVIGCVGTNAEENHAFVTLARHFSRLGLNVPQVLAVDNDEMRYLQTDLGTLSLFGAVAEGRSRGGQYSEEERRLLAMTISELPRMQFEGARGLDFACCFPQQEFDLQNVMFDLNYFKYCFLKPWGAEFNEVSLEHDFRRLANLLLQVESNAFMYRDFQARNVMLVQPQPSSPNPQPSSLNPHPSSPNPHPSSPIPQPYFIDFQGGRRGPCHYDVASFLYQASARYSDELRQSLLNDYYEAASRFTAMPPKDDFCRQLQLFVLFRTLQVLGAYGYRGLFERKQHFIDSIPPALDNLRQCLDKLPDIMQQLPCLNAILTSLTSSPSPQAPGPRPQTPNPKSKTPSQLTVRIFSFSYKKGIPEDPTGNGGGYVFDCRSTHNPGRYDDYKQLTGLDRPVIEFLERDGEITTFLESVYRLADFHVERYIERGFTSLMFAFGCTGGQHRSVYSAQHLAEHLHRKYGIRILLCHREQGVEQCFAAE